MPEPAPVTIATLSCRRAMCFSSSFDLWPQPYSGRGVDGRADRDHRDVRAARHADDQHDGVGNVAWRHRAVLAAVRLDRVADVLVADVVEHCCAGRTRHSDPDHNAVSADLLAPSLAK